MKTCYFLFLAYITFPFYAFSQIDSSYFKVTSSTTQSWAGGAAGSGSGTNYVFNLIFSKNVNISFDTVWITSGNGLLITLGNAEKKNNFAEGDSYTLYASQYYPGERDRYYGDAEIMQGSHPPVFYKGYALIRFKVKGKSYYYAVQEMQMLAPIAYP